MADKGLRRNALSFTDSVVIGVASTAPAYSLAATLGLIVAVEGIGAQAPAALLVSFLPILCIAFAYRALNRVDPDCGTTFTWVTRAFGPVTGWLGGWAIVVADVVVMANLAQIAGLYTFLLVGVEDPATVAVTAVGVAFIAVMTWVCVIGIELNARTQRVLLGAEVVALAAFAVVALVRVYVDAPEDAVRPALDWFSPLAIDSVDALVSGVLLGVFIYWGWDALVAVNEETEEPTEVPGRAAVAATVLLLGTYLVVATAAVSFGGTERLAGDESGDVLGLLADDVFGSALLGKLIVIAVLTSAAASCQTTILPTARTTLSMARVGAAPAALGKVHPRHQTPHWSTWWMGGVSIVWYVGLTLVSEDVLGDTIAALGLMIALYYGLTGVACAWAFRRQLTTSASAFLLNGLLPLLGGLTLLALFVRSCWDLAADDAGSGTVLGIGTPLVVGLSLLLLGPVLLLVWRLTGPSTAFFDRRRRC